MKNTQLKGFSFVEILMIITVLALISVVAYTSFGVRQNNAVNSKIQSEITSLGNALLLAKQENKILPQPQGNRNFFAEDTSYVHNFEDIETFGVHGFITHNTLAKKYIDIIPVDPRTGSFYAYGKSKGTGSLDEMYEIAGVVWDGDTPSTFVSGDYTAENGPFNLIREYNGPNFVHNESTLHFPYNPLERILTAKIDSYTGSVSINGINTYTQGQLLSYELKSGDTIEVEQNGVVELYYSDGSRSVLGDSGNDTVLTLQKMDFIQDNNIITDIKLVLESGMIWNKAASLDNESGFEIYTTDSTAAVRGTIFGVQKNQNNSEIIVKKGTVAIKQNNISSAETIKTYINNEDTTSIPTFTIPIIPGLIDIDNTETVIKVENNNPEKGASLGPTIGTSFSTGSINNIPTIIKDETVNNNPIINPNIKISLKEYSYSSNTNDISITLNIPKRVYKTADFLIINGSDIILKENWGTNFIQSGGIIIHTFDNIISPIDSANFTESDIVSQSINRSNITNIIDTSGNTENAGGINPLRSIQSLLHNLLYSSNILHGVHASVGSQDLSSYVSSKVVNGENNFTLQIGKKTLNGKIRVTNKIKFTIVDDKTYNNEEKEDNVVDVDEIIEESNQNLTHERGTERGCNGFDFDNISGDTELCADADNNLKINGWNLVAYAPYDHAGDLNLYQTGGFITNNYYNNSLGRENYITGVNCGASIAGQCGKDNTDFNANTYVKNDSFVTYNSTKGFYIDDQNTFTDKFKYYINDLNNLELDNNDDFIFEIRVNKLDRLGGPYQILRLGSSQLNLDLHNKELRLNGNTYTLPAINDDFHNLKIEYNKSLSKLYLYLDDILVIGPFSKSINTSSNIYIGTNSAYIQQYDAVIDYFKIYTK